MGQHRVGIIQPEGAEHSGRVTGAPALTPELHSVHGKGRFVFCHEHALGAPARERLGRGAIGVREDQPDRVVRVARSEERALVVVDHVVGWGADGAEVGVGAADGVANPGKWKKVGHRRDSVGDWVGTFGILAYGRLDSGLGPPRDGNAPSSEELEMESAYDAFQEGVRLLASDNPHAAVIALERARDLEPDKGSIREALARAYFRCRRFPAARAEFAEAVEIEPVNDYAHFGLGLCLSRQGDRLGARRHLKLAVAMRPDHKDYRDALSRVVDDADDHSAGA